MTYQEYKSEYGIRLDPAQDRACTEIDGHVLLLAVPGSGKTSVMIARLGYLIKVCGVRPSSVLAVTYSVAGALEMQKRYERVFGLCDVEIRTINGFCAKLIYTYSRFFGREPFTLIDRDSDATQIIKNIMISCGGYPSENDIKDVKTAITYCRNMLLTDEEIKKQIKIEGRDFIEIFKRYREYKRENRLMDYDDQLAYGYTILCKHPQIADMYCGDFRYICVDEAQDTSKIQHMIIRKVAEKTGNLFMVGDEDQSIYGFRAAYPEGLLEFDTVYPDAKVFFIEKNYRSTGNIVSAANRFIAENQHRRSKNMNTDNGLGDKIKRTELDDIRQVPKYICKTAEEYRDRKSGELAVLARLNDSLIPTIDVLSANGIPFTVRDADGLFFSSFIVNDIFSIMRFADDPFDSELFQSLYYKFASGISKSDVEYAMKYNTGKEMLPWTEFLSVCPVIRERVRSKMKKLTAALNRIRTADSYNAIKIIVSDSGYGKYVSLRTNDNSKVNTLLAIAERYRSKDGLKKRLSELCELVKSGIKSKNGAVLTTIHSSKGMEFDRVIICDARNGILPHVFEPSADKGYTVSELEEREDDRRLFYVAATRAKKNLELITYKYQFGEESEDFGFVNDLLGIKKKIPEKVGKEKIFIYKKRDKAETEKLLKAYTVGETVMHRQFGKGVILARNGEYAEIRFYRYMLPKRIDLTVCIEREIISLSEND